MRSILKVLKVAHEIYLECFEMPCIGIYSGLFEITRFLGVGCMSRGHTQYR
jgi:hypothetical protein